MRNPNISGDFAKVVDGLEAVTLTYRDGSSTEVAVTHAHRREIGWREAERSGGDAKAGDTVWRWPASEAATLAPLGSTITDSDGTVHTILEVGESHQVLGQYRARTRDLAHEARLDTLVTVQSATYAKDADGVAVPTWADAYTSVRAKVQPEQHAAEVEHGADEVERMVRIVLAADLAIVPGADYRVVDSDGEVYTVVRYEQTERIDVLPVLVCERTGTSGA